MLDALSFWKPSLHVDFSKSMRRHRELVSNPSQLTGQAVVTLYVGVT